MLQKQAHKRNTCPTAKTESQRLAACCHKLDDIRIQTYRSHRHNDKELGQRLERLSHLSGAKTSATTPMLVANVVISEASTKYSIKLGTMLLILTS